MLSEVKIINNKRTQTLKIKDCYYGFVLRLQLQQQYFILVYLNDDMPTKSELS